MSKPQQPTQPATVASARRAPGVMESQPVGAEENAARGNQNTHIAEACGYIKNPESLLPYKNYADAVRKLGGYHILADVDQEEADVAETNDGAGQNLIMSRRHVWRELMQRRSHACVETLAKLRVDLSQRTHAPVTAPEPTAAAAPAADVAPAAAAAASKPSQSGLYEAIKLEQWMKEERREREAKVTAELKALDDEIAALRTKRRRIEYETNVAKATREAKEKGVPVPYIAPPDSPSPKQPAAAASATTAATPLSAAPAQPRPRPRPASTGPSRPTHIHPPTGSRASTAHARPQQATRPFRPPTAASYGVARGPARPPGSASAPPAHAVRPVASSATAPTSAAAQFSAPAFASMPPTMPSDEAHRRAVMLLEMHKHQGPTHTSTANARGGGGNRRPHAPAVATGAAGAASAAPHSMPSIRPPGGAVRPQAVRPQAVPAGAVKRAAPPVAGQEHKKAKLQMPRKTVDL